MFDLSSAQYHPISEQIVDVLTKKTLNSNRLFFRVQVSYFLAKMASSMRCTLDTLDRGKIPVNVYALNLAPSGSGKGHSTNIIEGQFLNQFKNTFLQDTFPYIAQQNLVDIAAKRANKNSTDPADELVKLEKEFASTGALAFSFDSGTVPALKQLRHKLLLANAGAASFECYTGDVEILTSTGFKRFDALDHTEVVAQWNPATEEISWTVPENFVEKPYEGALHHLVTPSGFDMSVTENHLVQVINSAGEPMKVKPADLKPGYKIPLTGTVDVVSKHSLSIRARLGIAFQADGNIHNGSVRFGFNKERKIERLRDILQELCVEYSESKDSTGLTQFYISGKEVKDIPLSKSLCDYVPPINELSAAYCEQFIFEVVQWDGSTSKANAAIIRYTNTDKKNVELVQTLAVLAGYKTKMYNNPKEGYGDCWYVSIHTSRSGYGSLAYLDKPSGNQKPIHTTSEFAGTVYCVTVPTGAIVLRRNGKTFIGGNCDELGKNLIANMDLLTAFLELYDQGLIKQKLTKNTADSQRAEELEGKTPTNMLLFGTPSSLLNGGKEEDEFYALLETGYARRCLFGYSRKEDFQQEMSPEQVFDMLTDSTSNSTIAQLSQHFGMLADAIKYNQQIMVNRDVSIKLIAYKLHCEQIADKLPDHEEIRKAELRHRYFKALKLAGVYAFVDETPEVTEAQLLSAIKLVEESGEAFNRILSREKNYVKLANYIAEVGKEVTHVDLVEDLPFYKGSNAQKQELMNLAIAYGYKHHIIIKKTFVDGIEFFKGEALKPTDLSKLIASYSGHVAYNYLSEPISFSNLQALCQMDDMHWINHALIKGADGDGHRDSSNILPGFNVIVIDVDEGTSLDEVRVLMKDYTYFIHTTKRHQTEGYGDRFRLIMPINYHLKLDENEFREFMNNVYEWLPFKVDEQTSQRCRKWATHQGITFSNEGEILDALAFIPKTSKNDELKKTMVDLGNLDNLERWFAQRMGNGNRNNQLLKFAMMLADTGLDYQGILDKVLGFNAKLDSGLPEIEIHSTIMRSVSKKLSEK